MMISWCPPKAIVVETNHMVGHPNKNEDRMEMYVSEIRHRYFYVGTIHLLNGNGVMFYGASKSSIVFQNKRYMPNL